jgi:hypothetical protein
MSDELWTATNPQPWWHARIEELERQLAEARNAALEETEFAIAGVMKERRERGTGGFNALMDALDAIRALKTQQA